MRLKAHFKDTTLWLSLCAGLSLVFAYAPFSHWWLPFIVLPVWFIHLEKLIEKQRPSPKENLTKLLAKHSFLFGFGWFASGISWVHVSIAEFGGMPLIASLLLMLLLCLYLAIFPALCGYLTAKSLQLFNKPLTQITWLFSTFWLLTEYLRSIMLTGFPWLSLGYSQINGPLASLGPVIGEVGITFCLLLITSAVANLAMKQQLKSSIVAILFIAGASFICQQQQWVKPTGETITTALVQGNIEQSIKWQPEQQWPTMLKYLDLTRVNYDASLIIWPESAIPAIETMSTTQEFLEIADKSAAINHAAIITGIINYNFESREYFNSLIVLGKKHQEDDNGSYYYNHSNRYNKNHLLPIGEFVPFGDLLRPLAPIFNLPMSSFTRGNYQQPNLVANDIHLLPLICFEIAFTEQLAANFSNNSNILLTVSNDAWFGNSHGPHQHMEIARMRALEFGRPLLRATNNGVTAVTDHRGQITEQLAQFQQAVLTTKVQLVDGMTPYSRYGNYPVWILAFILVFIHLLKK
ncbi:apolipoprotein N-acyltransferase [Thalassotalea insulae]|nr:apolipoprotein N-acyltransferase [Thalassotalea insulae]